MRIIHLGKLCPPNEGGIELFSYDLLEYLNNNGIKADLLCFGNKNITRKYKNFSYFESKMIVKLNSAPLSYAFYKTFNDIAENYDIIHVHSPNPLAEILAIKTDKKVIIHWHSDIVKQKIMYKFYKPVQQRALKKAKKIIVTSPQYLETSEQLKFVKDKAVIIPSGLNSKRLANSDDYTEYEKIENQIKNKKIVLSVGRLVQYKGFEYLIESAKYLNDDTVILIAGGGPLYKELWQKIVKLNLQAKVILPGRVNNVSIFMKMCNLFCLPSITRNEAFGLVLVEALYFGKPVVTTNVEGSGMNYVNQDGKTGLVVEPKNPLALAEAINKILSDKKIYDVFSKNALERFKEFDISSIGQKIIDVYREVIKC